MRCCRCFLTGQYTFSRESGLEIENIKQNQMAWQSQVKTVDVVCWSIDMLRVEIESQIAQTTCRVCCLAHLVARLVIEEFHCARMYLGGRQFGSLTKQSLLHIHHSLSYPTNVFRNSFCFSKNHVFLTKI